MLPMGSGKARGILLEDIIMMFLPALFMHQTPLSQMPFRITRNTDFVMNLDSMDNLLIEMTKSVKRRSYGKIVRLEAPHKGNKKLLEMLQSQLEVKDSARVLVDGPLDLRFFMRELWALPGFDALRYPPFVPRVHKRLLAKESIFRTIRGGDLFFHHPYDSFDPVVRLVSESASDPHVLAIKQTLYRVSSNSPLIAALARAAQNGKQVTVLIEVRARFDEEHNIAWSKALEKAGRRCSLWRPPLEDPFQDHPGGAQGAGWPAALCACGHRQLQRCHRQALHRHGHHDLRPPDRPGRRRLSNLITGYPYTYPMQELIASPTPSGRNG